MAFRQLDFDTQHLLFFQRSALGQFLRHVQVVFRTADGVAVCLFNAQREGPEVRHRDLIGHRLVGPIALELSNIDGETCLAIPTHPTAEVTNQPLQFQFGQLVPGVEVEPNGY